MSIQTEVVENSLLSYMSFPAIAILTIGIFKNNSPLRKDNTPQNKRAKALRVVLKNPVVKKEQNENRNLLISGGQKDINFYLRTFEQVN